MRRGLLVSCTCLSRIRLAQPIHLELRLELPEPALEFPLRSSLFILIKERLTRGKLWSAENLSLTCSSRHGEDIRRGPEALTGKKVVLHAGACQLFQVCIAQVILIRSANILVSKVDPAYGLVVSRKRHRNMRRPIVLKRMLVAGDTENSII